VKPLIHARMLACLVFLTPLVAACGPAASENSEVAVKVADLAGESAGVIVRGIAFSPDGGQLAIDSDYENINIWDWRNHRIVKTITKAQGSNTGLTTNPLSYSPDGHLFAVCEDRGNGSEFVRAWNTNNWSIAGQITGDGVGGSIAMSFTPDSGSLIYLVDRSATGGDILVAVSPQTWQRVWSDPIEKNLTPASLAVSPNGAFAAIAAVRLVPPEDVADIAERFRQTKEIPTIYVVDLQQRKIVRTMQGNAMGPMAWSPDSARIVMGGRGYVEIYDVQSGRVLFQEKLEKPGTMNVRYASDGRYLLVSDLSGPGKGLGVSIWDSAHHRLLQQIPGNVGSISVSKDGRYLAVSTTGETAVWRFK